ncbi:WD40 repeat domain-containing protein, partial [Streptomyces sp. SBT349]|uniref:WD40 repeat domain-containing protein n=1 Tax=Streptomyces sp. SBT349 TaxID=1580539 RepID=UPI00066BE728
AARGFAERPALRLLGTLPRHPNRLAGLWFSPAGRTLASSEADTGLLRLWDVASQEPLGEPLTSAHVAFLSVAFGPDGTWFATGGGDRAEFWRMPSPRPDGEALGAPDHAVDAFEAVVLSPDGTTLATGGPALTYGQDIAEVRLWDVASRTQLGRTLTGHGGGVEKLAFGPEGATLAVGGSVEGDGVVRVWDVASRAPVSEPLTGHQGGVGEMAFSPDGATLAVSAYVGEGVVRFWDPATGVRRGEPLTGHSGGVRSLAYSGDGTALVTLGAQVERGLRFWDAETHEERSEPVAMEQYFDQSAFSADGLTLATHEDEVIRLWAIE